MRGLVRLAIFMTLGLGLQGWAQEHDGSDLSAPTGESQEGALGPIRIEVNLVTLRFTVRDPEGTFVNNLSAEDFEVFENRRPREIRFFEAPRRREGKPRPLWLAFLIDVSGSTFATRAEEILAAQAFLENVHSLTRVGVFGFAERLIVFEDFTTDRGKALQAFAAARSHMGKTSLYSNLEELGRMMAARSGPEDDRVIIVVSDGLDDDYVRAERTAQFLRDWGVVVYTVWVPSALELYISPRYGETGGDSAVRSQRQKEAFGSLSVLTGGRHFGGFEAILDFDSVMAEIENDLLGNLYTIGYETEFPFLDNHLREVELRTVRPELKVQGVFRRAVDWVEARRRYVSAMFSSPGLTGGAADPQMFGEFRDIAAELDLLRRRQEEDLVTLPFRLKIGPYALARDERGGVRTYFGVLAVLYDSSGREVARLREVFRAQLDPNQLQEGRGVIYTNRLLAPPGEYRLQVVLLEIPTWRMTVFQRPVQVR